MYLTNRGESSFQLSVVGYEFPEILDDRYDSNWLNINIKVMHPKGDWKATDACLLTFEIQELINWLDQIHNKKPVSSILEFIEPNLEIRIIDDKGSGKRFLRVYFELELRPDWAPGIGIMRDLWLDFRLDELDLEAIIDSLSEQLSKFPVRA